MSHEIRETGSVITAQIDLQRISYVGRVKEGGVDADRDPLVKSSHRLQNFYGTYEATSSWLLPRVGRCMCIA